MYDGENIIAEISGGGETIYLRDNTGIVSRTKGNAKEYFVTSYRGDTTAVVNANADILKSYEYDAFGNMKNATSADDNPFRYCGEYFDDETGFVYLRNRYYDPSIGRFTTEDPAKSGLNWYAYCENNPVKYVDPFGYTAILTGDKKYWEQTMTEMQMITDGILEYDKESGKISIRESVNGSKINGTKLLREQIESTTFNLSIQRNGLNPYGKAYSSEIISKKLGKEATVNMNDSVNAVTQVLVSVDGKSAYENTASFIVLAHELIHTYHVMNKTINEERLGERLYRNDSGILCMETSGGKSLYADEEFETVGLGYRTLWKGRDPLAINPFWCRSTFNLITENALRDEHNMNRRIAYTTK